MNKIAREIYLKCSFLLVGDGELEKSVEDLENNMPAIQTEKGERS